MAEAYIIDAVRTPVGKRGGGLSTVHPADLGGHVLKALVERSGVDPAAVDDVVYGCCDTIGPQAGDIARTCWLVAGLPDCVPGTTVDRQCGSSQQAVHFAAQAVMSGTSDLVMAGGVQNMSMIPISSAMTCALDLGHEDPFSGSKGWVDRYGTVEVSQFNSAEMIAEKWDCSREDLEVFALESHTRALHAIDKGYFEAPAYFQLCMGVRWGIEATPENLLFMKSKLPAGSAWSVLGVGRHQLAMVTMAMLLGGHVRVGFEDNLFMKKGVLAKSNAEFVEMVARLAPQLRREVATPEEAKKILGMG